MNILITNNLEKELSSLDVDIIKHISGTYSTKEIVDMFRNFFYNKMIIDVTAIDGNNDIRNYQSLVEGLDADKLILFLPEGSDYCKANFLSNLISIGIYNFTTNLEGIKYLLKKSNSYSDVSHIQKLGGTNAESTNEAVTVSQSTTMEQVVQDTTIVYGIRNATDHAGATTLTYMMVKELSKIYGTDKVLGLEIDKSDFKYFKQKNLLSTTANNARQAIGQSGAKYVIIDLNKSTDSSMCNVIIYLIEPSIVRLNKMIDRNKLVLEKLKNKMVILNKSLLSNKDVNDLEYESGLKIFYNIPPLNDRKNNEIIVDFLGRINLIQKPNDGDKKIFGLFRR
ncbi:MAG: hypothetical protein IJL76_03315 [Bacilli bacterium]|nr:hypothetical protein [Bacilli bacterium]